jgi:RNA-directed DNA polymerase
MFVKEFFYSIQRHISQYRRDVSSLGCTYPRGLKLSEEKTLVTNINEGFNFLGWNFRKYKGKLLPKPSKKSQAEVTRKISDMISKAKAWDQDRLI